MQTVNSVGYGDTDLENNYERIFALCVMIIGVILQTVANGSLISIAETLGNSGEYSDKLEVLNRSKKLWEMEHADFITCNKVILFEEKKQEKALINFVESLPN
jgi:hypothetical protein